MAKTPWYAKKDTPEEKARKLAAARSKRGSESRQRVDLKPLIKNIGTRSDRAYLAGISGLGGAALGASGLVGKLIGDKEADNNLTRARGAFKDVGKFAKAAVMGEPKGEKYLKVDPNQPLAGIGRYYMRGSDVDWEKKEKKAAGGPVSKPKPKPMPMPTDNKKAKPLAKGGTTKKYAKGGSVSASRRADGIARKGKTRGKVC